MKKFINNIFWLSIVPISSYMIVCIIIIPDLLEKKMGPNTKTQIIHSFNNIMSTNFDLILLGNSRIYRGVNPDKIKISSYNFSHDNDSYNQLYYKLKYLEKKNKDFKYLVLGVDFFQFSVFSDSRNFVYENFFDKNYILDYGNRNNSINQYYSLLKIEHFKSSLNIISGFNKKPAFLRKNGQYIQYNIPMSNDIVKRDATILNTQLNYFELIIEHCKKKNIKVYLCMLPIQKTEKENYTSFQIKKFHSLINNYLDEDVKLLDYTDNHKINKNDYLDITHFNELGANRFSEILNNDLKQLID